jgi:hypothetical protein
LRLLVIQARQHDLVGVAAAIIEQEDRRVIVEA